MDSVKQSPLVSIITVVYNARNTLEKTIQSVIEQSYPHWEYLIIDGNSMDGSTEIIKKYEQHLAYWVSEPDNGIYDAMNKGLQRAKGQLIGIINADDWYERTALEHVVEAFRASPQTGVFHGLLKVIDKNGDVKSVTGHSAGYLHSGMIEHPTCFVQRSVYEQWGCFDPGYKSAGDYELMLRFRRHNVAFMLIPHIIANFREGGMSTSWSSTKETLDLQRQYHIISLRKRALLLCYWYIKQKLLASRI